MHKAIGHVLDGEFSAARSEIALLVPVALKVSIDRAHHCKATDVELSVFVK